MTAETLVGIEGAGTMAWRYTFDDGPEKAIDVSTTLYMLAAMQAFAREAVTDLHCLPPGGGLNPYKGHVLKLWDDKLLPQYPPTLYGIALDQYSDLKIVGLGKSTPKGR
jgi:hypothetical protein